MKIVSYSPECKNDFVEMNRHWISSMFAAERTFGIRHDIKRLSAVVQITADRSVGEAKGLDLREGCKP